MKNFDFQLLLSFLTFPQVHILNLTYFPKLLLQGSQKSQHVSSYRILYENYVI